MVRSMTGFGSSQVIHQGICYKVDARSVNHRYCEVSLKLPRDLVSAETTLRGWVTERFSRGRFDVTVSRDGVSDSAVRPMLNLPVAQHYVEILRSLERHFDLQASLRAVDLLQLRDVMTFEERSVPKDITSIVRPVFRAALDHLEAMRRDEGKALTQDIAKRISHIETTLVKIERRLPKVLLDYGKRLRKSVFEFVKQPGVDQGRILQEVALMADRRDVSEEVVRLRSHIAQFRKILEEGKEVGRRLDFLIQELHREMNTIVSKAGDAKVAQDGVEIKSEIEKIREQIQNVE